MAWDPCVSWCQGPALPLHRCWSVVSLPRPQTRKIKHLETFVGFMQSFDSHTRFPTTRTEVEAGVARKTSTIWSHRGGGHRGGGEHWRENWEKSAPYRTHNGGSVHCLGVEGRGGPQAFWRGVEPTSWVGTHLKGVLTHGRGLEPGPWICLWILLKVGGNCRNIQRQSLPCRDWFHAASQHCTASPA